MKEPCGPGVTATPSAQGACLIYELGIAFKGQHILSGLQQTDW